MYERLLLENVYTDLADFFLVLFNVRNYQVKVCMNENF